MKKFKLLKDQSLGLFSMALALSLLPSVSSAKTAVTEGNGIRYCINATIDNKDMLYISDMDGAVSLYNAQGKKVWANNTIAKGLSLEIVAADITGDGNDDLLMANGDGFVYAWSSKGDLLWKFTPENKVRLTDLAVINEGKGAKIFAGGNDYTLYELDAKGKKLSETVVEGSIRKIESGNFIDKDKESLFVFTLQHDKFNSDFWAFIDPKTKKVISSSSVGKVVDYGGLMLQDFSVVDIDKDGKDDLLMSGTAGCAVIFAMNGNFKPIFQFTSSKTDSQRYNYGMSTSLLPSRDEVIMQCGGVMYQLQTDGRLLSKSGAPYSGVIYNDLVYIPSTNELVGAGQIGGDNTLYYYDLADSKWFRTQHEFDGLYKEVANNINTLYQQCLDFKLPSYQTKKEKAYCMMLGSTVIEAGQTHWVETKGDPEVRWLNDEVAKLDGGNLDMATEFIVSENYDRSYLVDIMGKDGLRKDTRKPYVLTQKQIVDWALEQEKNGNNFSIWAGHGSDPLFMDITTLEKIIEAAPNHCKGLLYAEMSNVEDPRVIFFVDECVPRIAKAIRDNKSDAKLYFRYKNMFWGADCHAELWRKMFFSGKYNDILVPSAEDTNNRLQDINFSGRVGMWQSGYINDYAMRLVDDNPTSWRPASPGGQRSVSPYLRNAAIMAAYGCRYGVLFDINYLEDPGYNSFFALLKSGVIPVVEREDVLSIGSWHVMKDMDYEYLEESINNGHDLLKYSTIDDDKVFANAGVHWCGASVQDYDYSKMMGVKYRWLNFMPEMPNGMIPITDYEYEPTLKKQKANYVASTISEGFVKNKKVPAKEFGSYMKDVVEEGARKMIARVSGASWSMFKIDDNHARLILVDPGYVDPQERIATITFQAESPMSGVDILSGEKFATAGKNSITVTVPAGTMRFIDFEYKTSIEKLRK